MSKNEIIDIFSWPVQSVLAQLLQDKTTKQNIILAADTYFVGGEAVAPEEYITEGLLRGMGDNPIQPRHVKSRTAQQDRTKKKAEVFTPVWICNRMNNFCDEEWFGVKNVFNVEIDNGRSWQPRMRWVAFPEDRKWQDYVDSTRIEITCGEAPFLVSRYDAADGSAIEISRRIGMLDRKLRVVSENVNNEEEWLYWTYRAFQSVYGYEYQGDNLLIARVNLLMTFFEYLESCLKRKPTDAELRRVANIICWNIWQMDGLTGTVPLRTRPAAVRQETLFSTREATAREGIPCLIYDWRANRSIRFDSMRSKKKEKRSMK